MPTEVLARAKPAARATLIGTKVVPALAPRVTGAIRVLLRDRRCQATRDKLRRAASALSISIAELEAALRTAIDVVEPGIGTGAIESSAGPATKPSCREFDPRAAGERLVEVLKEAEGGAWTGAALQSRFGLTSAVLHRRRKEHRILCWRDAQHEFHYPQWQFTPTGALLPGLQEVLQTFRSSDEWRLMSYFLGPRQQLDDRRPLDLLREGNHHRVLEHARVHAQENTW
jgi:hypothetical protein